MKAESAMQKEWEERAQTNAYHWVMSNEETWDKDAYYQSGTDHIQQYVLPFFEKHSIKKTDYAEFSTLDIGCGTGRLSRALSTINAKVTGIDISKEMIEKAKNDNADHKSITFVQGSGIGLQPLNDNSFDFCFSFIVFQHIPNKNVILSYFSEIQRVLKDGGRAKFQVRGTPGNPPGKVLWFKGFTKAYIALCLWRGVVPLLWFRKYDSVYGACFTAKELHMTLQKIGFTGVATYHETEKYLWAEVQK